MRIPVNDRFVDSLSQPLPAGYFLPASARATSRRRCGCTASRCSGSAPTGRTRSRRSRGCQLTWAHAGVPGTPSARRDGHLDARRRARSRRGSTSSAPRSRWAGSSSRCSSPKGGAWRGGGTFDRLLGSEFGTYSGLVYGSGAVREFPMSRALRAPVVPMRVVQGGE